MSFDTAAGTATAKLDERLLADSESKIFLRTIRSYFPLIYESIFLRTYENEQKVAKLCHRF